MAMCPQAVGLLYSPSAVETISSPRIRREVVTSTNPSEDLLHETIRHR
jgi:hypothetical protein